MAVPRSPVPPAMSATRTPPRRARGRTRIRVVCSDAAGERSQRLDCGVDVVLRPRRHDDLGAVGDQGLRCREAEPARPSGDDIRPAPESQIHELEEGAQHVLQDAAVAEVVRLLGRVDPHARFERLRYPSFQLRHLG